MSCLLCVSSITHGVPQQSAISKYYQVSDIPFSCFHSFNPPSTHIDCFKNMAFRQCYQVLQALPQWPKLKLVLKLWPQASFQIDLAYPPDRDHYYYPHTQHLSNYLPNNPSLPVEDDFDLHLVVLICQGDGRGHSRWKDRYNQRQGSWLCVDCIF